MGDTAPPRTVREGDWVVLEVNGERSSFVQLLAGGKVKIARRTVPVAPMVGVAFGTQFTLSMSGEELLEFSGRSLLEETTKEVTTDKDNSLLRDDGTNQGLSAEELEALKGSAKDGAEIIDALCSKSKSFGDKTVFSQEKYRKKKARKYQAVATVRRPTAATVADSYFRRVPTKICGLRPDTLAVMLTMANVGPHQQVLVMDMCAGLVAAAVTERLGGMGECCAVYAGQKEASMDALRFFNFTPEVKGATTSVGLGKLEGAFRAAAVPVVDAKVRETCGEANGEVSPATGEEVKGKEEEGEGKESVAAVVEGEGKEKKGEEEGGVTGEQVADAGTKATAMLVDGEGKEKEKGEGKAEDIKVLGGKGDEGLKAVDGKQWVKRASPWAASEEQVGRWAASGGFTSCLVAAPALQPIAVMDRLLPLLAPSAPFAIFSNSPLPLAMAMAKLRKTGQALALQMTENWHREYQVLPARTHPTMSTSGTGGYILSGIKVISPPRTEADRSAKKPRT